MDKKYIMILAALLVGYMAHDQIAKLPGVNKLPQF
jgi:hypothetical protein